MIGRRYATSRDYWQPPGLGPPLDTMIERLADDHANARRLAEGLANIEGLSV